MTINEHLKNISKNVTTDANREGMHTRGQMRAALNAETVARIDAGGPVRPRDPLKGPHR